MYTTSKTVVHSNTGAQFFLEKFPNYQKKNGLKKVEGGLTNTAYKFEFVETRFLFELLSIPIYLLEFELENRNYDV